MGGNCAQKVHHTSLITTNLMYIVKRSRQVCSGGIKMGCRNVFITTKYQLKYRTLENQHLKSYTDVKFCKLLRICFGCSYSSEEEIGRVQCPWTIEHRIDYWCVTSCRLRENSYAALYQPTQWYALIWHLTQSCFSVKIFIADLEGTRPQDRIQIFNKNG